MNRYPDPERFPLSCDRFEGYDPCAICRRTEDLTGALIVFTCTDPEPLWCWYHAWCGLSICFDCLTVDREVERIRQWYKAALLPGMVQP